MTLIFISLWISNAMACAFTVLNAICWKKVQVSIGQFQLNLPFLWKLTFSRYFIIILAVALANVFVTYYIQAIMGVGKGQFFLYFGNVVLIIANYRLGEKFTRNQVIGAVLIVVGSVLLSS